MALNATVQTQRFVFAGAIVFITLLLESCLFVKAPKQDVHQPEHAEPSPLPKLEMSDELVRTSQGDMIALLPKGWVLLDPGMSASESILVVAVNPDYSCSAVFSNVNLTASTQQTVAEDDLLGLARHAFSLHQRKSGGVTKLVDSYAIDTLGTRLFGTYSFTGTGGMRTRCAVFTSTLGNHYQFAVVPLASSGREVPSDRLQEQYFTSILATIQF